MDSCGHSCPNVSTTPIMAMGCRQCLPFSVVQLKGKHCRKPQCRNGVVDTFEHCPYDYDKKNKIQIQSFSRTLPFRSVWKEHKIMSNMTSHNAVSWNKREKLHTQCTKRFFFSILKETFLVFVINCCMVPLIFFFFFFATMLFMYLYFKTVCFCICYKEVKKKGFWQKDIQLLIFCAEFRELFHLTLDLS